MIRGIGGSLVSLVAFGCGRALFLLAVANFYGPSMLGVVALATTVMVLLALVLGVGAESSAIFLAGRRPEAISTLRRNALLLGIFSLLASIPVLLLGYWLLGESVFSGFGTISRLSLPLLVACQVGQSQIQGILVGLGQFRAVTRGHILHHGALIAGVLALVGLRMPGETVLPLYAATLALKAAYQGFTMPLPEGHGRANGSYRLLVEQNREGIHMMLGHLANLLNYRLDSLFIAYFLTPTDVGVYAAATIVAEATLYLPRGLGQAAFSWASSLREGPERQGAAHWPTIRRLIWLLTLSGLVLAGIVWLALPTVVPLLFGAEFAAAVPPARVLLVAAFFNGMGLLAMNLLYGTGQARLNSRAGAAAAGLNAAANLALIPPFGILGAAFGSLLSYTTYAAVAVRGLFSSVRQTRPQNESPGEPAAGGEQW